MGDEDACTHSGQRGSTSKTARTLTRGRHLILGDALVDLQVVCQRPMIVLRQPYTFPLPPAPLLSPPDVHDPRATRDRANRLRLVGAQGAVARAQQSQRDSPGSAIAIEVCQVGVRRDVGGRLESCRLMLGEG